MKTLNIEIYNDPVKLYVNKDFSEKNMEEVISLIKQYDFYFEYIDDYRQWERALERNKGIKNELKSLGVEKVEMSLNGSIKTIF